MLGNNRHWVSLEAVSTVLTFTRPSLQRGIDDDHVRAMVKDQCDEFERTNCFSMLQSITVAKLNDRIYVLDGQHRIRAFDLLRQENKMPVETLILPVVHYSVSNLAELTEYYTRINKHRPVHPLELRNSWQSFEKPFVEWMISKNSMYMKNGKSTRSPHIGIEQLKTELDNRSTELVQVCDGKYEILCESVSSFNVCISDLISSASSYEANMIPSDMMRKLKDCEKKITIARAGVPSTEGREERKGGVDGAKMIMHHRKKKRCGGADKEAESCCYLGAFRRFEWLDVCVFSMKNGNKTVSRDTCWALLLGCRSNVSSKSNGATTRIRIPQSIRKLVWGKVNAPHAFLGNCHTCNQQLSFENMECGHVVAHALGGTTEINNLMPVCKTCNMDMGIQNMETYRRRICEMRGDGTDPDQDEPMWDAVSDI